MCVTKGKKASKKNEVGIFPLDSELSKLPAEELEREKAKIFLQLQALLEQEGYKINKEFVAEHEDKYKPYFVAKFCRNGYSIRTIKNFPGWGVIIYYQRYRLRQERKVRGNEKTTNFQEIVPSRYSYETAIKELAKILYKDGFSVGQIVKVLYEQKGWKVTDSAVKSWVSEVGRANKKIDFDIEEIYKQIVQSQKNDAVYKPKKNKKNY